MKMKQKVIGLILTIMFFGTRFLFAESCCPDSEVCKPNGINENKMLIPEDKGFSKKYVEKLCARGEKEVYSGKALETIGMPCGGIGCGQLYLCGDGTLGDWQIFGHAVSRWVEGTSSTFACQKIRKPVNQGFAVAVKTPGSKPIVKTLCAATDSPALKGDSGGCFGYDNIQFNGEFPIATVNYSEKDFPVKVSSEVFSPFIPLDAKDSAFPATIFNITVENCSGKNVEASVLGWLENMVCMNSREAYDLLGETTFTKEKNAKIMLQGIKLKKEVVVSNRLSIIFEDFEGTNWGNWTVKGKAFGNRPARIKNLLGQTRVSGMIGAGYANSMHDGDKTKGTLISREFIISNKYINFLIGGGNHKNTSINLVIDGDTVETARGINNEELRWRSWLVDKLIGKKAKIVIRDRVEGGWGHINIDNIEFSNLDRRERGGSVTNAVDFGNIALSCLEASDKTAGVFPSVSNDLYVTDNETYPLLDKKCGLLSTKNVDLKPGEKKTFSFVLSWYFPNKPEGWLYAQRFSDSADVAKHIIKNFNYLCNNTRKWRDLYYDSTLPYWLLDRLHSTISYLATGTAYWRKNGRFYAFEGCTCCRGTCTHVWGYAQTHARLFPSLARNIRERQDFTPVEEGGGFFPETGLVAFRGGEDKLWLAVDGQCDTVLNSYREHLMSADKKFLKRNWNNIKKALGYLIEMDAKGLEGGKDSPSSASKGGDLPEPQPKSTNAPNGIIEGTQHNTYDINYQGPNTLIGALYLAALRAGEEMANEVGDINFAVKCRRIFEKGKDWTLKNLWNGEYFVQDVDLEEFPYHQYKNGCLSDQLFGQFWARQVGLGYIYPEEHVKCAMNSIYKYNWAPDVGPYNERHKPFRWFIKNEGQGGLFTCTWPKGDYLPAGTSYKNEIWTGIEYQVAAGLIAEGFVTEGLAICYAIHDRYQPGFLNPYNEIECGDHYARALSSWGVYLALAGFQYDGPNGFVGFAPVITPENFKAAFTFAEGWATFEQTREKGVQTNKIIMAKGNLKIKTLSLAVPKKLKSKTVKVSIDEKDIMVDTDFSEEKVLIKFPDKINLLDGQTLEVLM